MASYRCSNICHGKLSVPIMADLFAPVPCVARAGGPSYTDSAPPVTQFTSRLSGAVICKHPYWEMSINYITMENLVGGYCVGAACALCHELDHFGINTLVFSLLPLLKPASTNRKC